MLAPCRNAGVPLDLDWIAGVRMNEAEVERDTSILPGRRNVSQAQLLTAVRCMDLTTLNASDTPQIVGALCSKAMRPLPTVPAISVAAVCVFTRFVATAAKALQGTAIPVSAATGDFPLGQSPLPCRIAEIKASLDAGAREIDIVITRSHALNGDWRALYNEVLAFREAAGPALLKVILATGDLQSLETIAKASLVAMMAGADFIKTSTGKETVNATLPAGLAMARAIREYRDRSGFKVGLKPAGGIRTADQALDWLTLVKEELGQGWLRPSLFRIGASSLLDDIERRTFDALK
ncbi:MAG: deoxyribose-phosphate aldolase [Fimbriimonadales bacterium]